MAEWIKFTERLPAPVDANAQGYVQGLLASGEERLCLWDWIPPTRPTHLNQNPHYAEYSPAAVWAANGWTHWRPLR